jgi:hypothetical protein
MSPEHLLWSANFISQQEDVTWPDQGKTEGKILGASERDFPPNHFYPVKMIIIEYNLCTVYETSGSRGNVTCFKLCNTRNLQPEFATQQFPVHMIAERLSLRRPVGTTIRKHTAVPVTGSVKTPE